MLIRLIGDWDTKRVTIDGKSISPEKSQKIRNHSPDGFNWGYGGSGPAQLALAIVLELFGNTNGYQEFKFEYIARLPQGHVNKVIDISDYVRNHQTKINES